MSRISWCLSLFIITNNLVIIYSSPPRTSTGDTAHFDSYVHGYKTQELLQNERKFEKFHIENIRSVITSKENFIMRGAVQQLLGSLVENPKAYLNKSRTVAQENENYQKSVKDNEISFSQLTDDLMDEQKNTLESGFRDNEQHESPKNDNMWQRSKHSIPVLESVRHLVNTVRDGHLNHTEHVQQNHTLLSEPTADHNESIAIETEEEREMINGSTNLQFLEVIGSIGSKIWGFLSNIRQVFAASTGSASAASSASSSSSSS